MKRITVAALAAVLMLGLAGCAESAGAASTERAAAENHEAAALHETAEPLVADTTEPVERGTDAAYLSHLREALAGSGGNSIPDATDEQLVAAGRDACAQMSNGVALEDVRVIEDEPMTGVGFKDSLRIAAVAATHFCSEFDPEG